MLFHLNEGPKGRGSSGSVDTGVNGRLFKMADVCARNVVSSLCIKLSGGISSATAWNQGHAWSLQWGAPIRVHPQRLLRWCEDVPVKEWLRKRGVVWFFNSPHSSQFGGVWERLVRETEYTPMLSDIKGYLILRQSYNNNVQDSTFS